MIENNNEVFPGMSVEEMCAVYFNTDALREPPYKVYQLNSDGYRYYYRFNASGEPEFYPSVTTLLKQVMPTPPALLDWMIANGKEGATEKRDMAAAYGTFMHGQFESLIVNRYYDFDNVAPTLIAYMEANNIPESLFSQWIVKIRKDVLAFAQFVKDWNVKPLAIEIALVHPEHRYAGCLDMPCVMTDPKTGDTFTALVDFKSGRKGFYEEHELQLHLYKPLWNVNFPHCPIERVFNFAPKDWRTKPTYNLKDQTDSVNAKKIPYLLSLATIEDENRDNTLTIVRGILYLDKGKIADNILNLSLAELIKAKSERKDAPEEAAEAPTITKEEIARAEMALGIRDGAPQMDKKATKRAVKANEVTDPINSTSDTGKAPETAKSPEITEEVEKLPFEKDMADGTGIEVKTTDEGVEVTARYFELAKDNLFNDEIEF